LPFALAALTAFLSSRHAHAEEALPKEGRFGAGVGITPLGLGPTEVFSAGGHAIGLRLWGGAQIDLGPHWALRLPLVFAVASGGSKKGYAEFDIVPGILYRFRSRADESFSPYAGAGVKLGVFGADRQLLGLPSIASTTQALDFDHHHSGDGHSSDPDFDGNGAIGGELWLGGSWHLGRWVSLDLDLSASMFAVDSVLVVTTAQTVAARVTL
jgi:hypothetical protein